MNDWHQIHRSTFFKKLRGWGVYRGTNDQTPPMSYTSICQMCHLQIPDSADCILMKLGIIMYFTTAFKDFFKSSLFQFLLTGF